MSVDVVKGFTKMQCLMFTLLSAADLDLNQPETMKLLEPLYPVLDKAWMIPCHAPRRNCGLLGGVFIVWVTDSITPTLYHLQLITLGIFQLVFLLSKIAKMVLPTIWNLFKLRF